MKKALEAILWRKANRATIDTLEGHSKGQYHITLSSEDYTGFFRGLSPTEHTKLGGFEYKVPIEAFDGNSPVDKRELIVRFMGPDSQRKDWNIRAQRPFSAYELWRPNRAFDDYTREKHADYLVIARDINSKFHARWIRTADLERLPDKIKAAVLEKDAGWVNL